MEITNLIDEFAKLANLAENEVADLYTVETDEDGNEVKKIADVNEAVSKIKTGIANKFSDIQKNHYGRGLKEGASKFESHIKQHFESDKQGTELLEDYLSHLESKTNSAKKELKAEDIKSNPAFKDLLNAEVSALKEEADRVKAELENERNKYYTEKLTDKAQSEAIKILNKLRWVQSDDPDQAEKQKKAIFSLIDYSKVKLDNGQLVLVDEAGEVLKDQYHNPVSYESYIETLNPFGTHKVNPNQKAPTVSANNSAPSELKIRTQDEYNAYVRKYPKQRLEAMRAYRAHLEA